MPTALPKVTVVDALTAEFEALDELLATLPAEAWRADTACPGWDVQANVAHVIGTESTLAGLEPPATDADVEAPPHVRNDIGRFNELWVTGLAGEPPAALLARFRTITQERLTALRAMSDAEWNAEGFTPAGQDTYGRFMRIRVFDCWMHEQDIRAAVGVAGHQEGPAVDMALDEVGAALPYIVGKRAGAPSGTRLTILLTGATSRRFHVQVEGRAQLVEQLDQPATATIELPLLDFVRLAGGRIAAADVRSNVGGDEAVARTVLENLAYTI